MLENVAARGPGLVLMLLLLTIDGCATIRKANPNAGPISEDYSKRTLGTVIDDQQIESRAKVNIAKAHADLAKAHVVVVSFNGVVLLAGQVASEELRNLAAETVKNMRKVRIVHNELSIAGPTSLIARGNDAWLTTKVKTAMAASSDVVARRIKVVTENGVVYMMGLVTRDEADAAVRLARKRYGVQKIVKVFEYIN